MAGKKGMKGTKPKVLPPGRFHKSFLAKIDGRSELAVTLKTRLAQLHQDLGGFDALSYQQRSLCSRAIFYEARLIALEVQCIESGGKDFSTQQHTMMMQTLINIFRALGLHRRTRDVSDLRDRLAAASHQSQQPVSEQ